MTSVVRSRALLVLAVASLSCSTPASSRAPIPGSVPAVSIGPGVSAKAWGAGVTTWTAASAANLARSQASLTSLGGSKLMIAGGQAVRGGAGDTVALGDVWLLDVGARTLTAYGALTTPREGHVAASLGGGSAIVVGGDSGSSGSAPLASVEIYDPTSGAWSVLPPAALGYQLEGSASLTLADGRLMVLGGVGFPAGTAATPDDVTDVELIDLKNLDAGWSSPAIAQLPHPMTYFGNSVPGLVRATTGTIVVAGTYKSLSGDPVVSVLKTDAAVSKGWTEVPVACLVNLDPSVQVGASLAATSNGGLVLVFQTLDDAGGSTTLCEFDENGVTKTLLTSASTPPAESFQFGVTLGSGRVLFAGATASTGSANSSVFDPVAGAIVNLLGPFESDGSTVVSSYEAALVAVGGENAVLLANDTDTPITIYSNGATGTPCTDATGWQCATAFCFDGFCCDTDCHDDCRACNVTGHEGTCTVVAGTPVGGRACPTGQCCDGTHASCEVPEAGVCAAEAGVDAASDVSSDVSDVSSDISDVSSDVSDVSSDVSDVSSDISDVSSDVSDVSSDVSDVSSDVSDVSSDAAVAAADVGVSDAAPQIQGTFTRCTSASECATGFCVDEVCCDSACGDLCHSCALPTSPGKCALVPLGVDPRKSCGGGASCVSTCDGKGACTAASAGTTCAVSSCTGQSTGSGPSVCTSEGSGCPTGGGTGFDCREYACDSAFGACKTTCADSTDCAGGYTCDTSSNHCVVTSSSSGSSGGCAVRANDARNPGSRGLEALAAAALLAIGRRARPRARRVDRSMR